MPRETALEKGRRYAGEGRLQIHHVDEYSVKAICRGGGAIYQVGADAAGWFCDCPSKTRCSHIHALQLVVVAPTEYEERWYLRGNPEHERQAEQIRRERALRERNRKQRIAG